MCSPLLFTVFLRPSFGACAPPSPNSWWNLNYLRRVGRLLMIILPSGNLFRRMRATFPQFVVELKLSPQSGKTFNDNSTKRKPLSAQGATLPEGESFSAEWEDKRYVSFNLPSGKAIFPDSDLKQARYITINYNKLQIFTKVGL